MARRLDNIQRKKEGVKPSFYRAKQIYALVPRSGRESDDDEGSEPEDEFQQVFLQNTQRLVRNDDEDNESKCSSPAPSLPSSVENMNLMSDEEIVDVPVVIPESPSIASTSVASLNSIPPSPFASTPSEARPRRLHIQSNPLVGSVASHSSFVPPSPATSASVRAPRLIIARPRPIRQAPLNFHWEKKPFQHRAEICDRKIPDHEDVKSPYEYFSEFFSDDIITYITEQTNLYSVQQTGKPLNLSKQDIKDFIAINLIMGIVNLPAYTDYWSQEFRYSPIADVMPLKKFQLIRRHIHFNNNLLDDGDRYFKIRPLVEKIRANFLKVPHETRFSIDEMMVPYKGKKAGNRKQYVKNKPKKWGFKIFVRAGVSGFVYDFIVYGGEDTFRCTQLSPLESGFGLGAKVVVALCKSIPDPACSVVYFDNFFTGMELINYLRKEMGIFSLGTIRSNRLRGAEKKLASDKDLKKKPRGSHSQVVCNTHKISVVKWYDNKCVTTASSYVDASPMSTIQRYDKVSKKRTSVPCPEIIKHYNAHMGGVDLADMLIALYRTELKGHRWYLPLVSQILDMCVINSWLLYRRHSQEGKTMPLKRFRHKISQSLLLHDMGNTVAATDIVGPTPSKKIKAPVAPRPSTDIRYDQVGHFPVFVTKGRCKLCIKGQTTVSCSKCSQRLCLLADRNCFVTFHLQK